MNKRLGVVMDPIATITIKKDTTFAILLAAQARGWSIRYFEQSDLYLRDGRACGRARALTVRDDRQDWYTLGEPQDEPLAGLDVLLMRKDPPFDLEYIYTTYLLERAEAEGVRVVNRPQSLRDANEKLFTAWFPQCCPPTLATRDMARLRGFVAEHGDAILKPLDGMGGAGIFRVRAGDANLNVIVETLTERGRRTALAQRFIPEISAGDKRILMIDGEPVPYALARIPAEGETRGNLAAGGRGVGQPLSERDRWICAQVGPELRRRGLVFVGLDVIGDWLTEINVTSPTCARELDAQFGLDIGADLMRALEATAA
ncbi:MAG TPA: glutathione synthase [Plasticicumulans sp.]|uniref:glutathione synthase n=1 Tax=Plasticicumulans sp. TaxID=2307179 RepID=UPI002C416A2A|nr:glutathione synthase [Plasticicumulans sp.]HMW28856.1 glutathione synthase [Plasticicumulans sp.]HNF64398.1 glutathione synthase [Plasticicumulans sp.]HNJ08534.1 glutathione synthase [Plasticicumulans sp.]HNM43686.1 glutathione synthase [Plasticicumulans sp.]